MCRTDQKRRSKEREIEYPWPPPSNIPSDLHMDEHTMSAAVWNRAWLWKQAWKARSMVSLEKQYKQP